MSRFNKKFSIIPYASITTDMVNNSTHSDKDHMKRAVRGQDNVIVVYYEANRSTYTAYPMQDFRTEYNDVVDNFEFSSNINNETLDFVEVKGDIRDATSSEIYDIEITTAGTGYSAGSLTATGGGGGSFKGIYAVNGSGVITDVRIFNMGTGYTSTPTIVISDSGDGNAVLTPVLRGESLENNTRVLDISLKDDLTYASTLTIDKNSTATASETTKGLSIDYDHTGISASGQTINNIALDIDVNSDSPTMVGTVVNQGLNVMCQGGTSGTQSNIGMKIITRDADTNDGISIQCDGTHLKLIAIADTDDYATLSVADTGDLTIATVGDGTTDSDLILDVDGSIELNADAMTAGNGIKFKDNLTKFADFQVHHSATWLYLYENGGVSNDDYFGIECLANGESKLHTIDTAGTAAHLTLDIDGDIALDSHTGVFIAKKAGTEFSAANSSYAGMILGYTDIGLNETAATYDLTTSYAVPTDEFGVTFTAPPSGNVEIYIQVQCNMGSSNAGDLYAGLSTANATTGYSRLALYHEVELFDAMSRGAVRTITHSWTITGLTAGTSYTYYAGFKSTSTTGTPQLQWGGDATNTTPDFIMKAIALPATIST